MSLATDMRQEVQRARRDWREGTGLHDLEEWMGENSARIADSKDEIVLLDAALIWATLAGWDKGHITAEEACNELESVA